MLHPPDPNLEGMVGLNL